MVALEHEGYLVQPHTSAGRIPTDKGYRFFVDHLAEPGRPGPGPAPEGQPVLRPGARRDGGDAGADLGAARRADLVRRGGGGPVARVGRRPLGPAGRPRAPPGPGGGGPGRRRGREAHARARRRRGRRRPGGGRAPACSARPVDGLLGRLRPCPPTGDRPVDRVVAAAAAALAELAPAERADQVFVGGPSRLAGAFDAVETVRSVLAILEQQLVVVTLLRDVLDRGLSVAIGTEHGYEPLASCARGGGAGLGRRPRGRRRRAARADPDGLPPGAGRRPRGGRAAGRADRRSRRRRPARRGRGPAGREADVAGH